MFYRNLFDPTDSHYGKEMLLGHHLESLKVRNYFTSIYIMVKFKLMPTNDMLPNI
jgi:hypothetical protein